MAQSFGTLLPSGYVVVGSHGKVVAWTCMLRDARVLAAYVGGAVHIDSQPEIQSMTAASFPLYDFSSNPAPALV